MVRPARPTSLAVVLAAALAAAGCGGSDDDRNESTEHDAGADAGTSPPPPPVPDDCITDVTPGHQTITCEGLTFELAVAPSCLEKTCGLIVDVHGFGMAGALQELHTKLRDLGNEAGYAVLQPTAPGQVPATSWSAANDAQVLAFLDRVVAAWHLDQKRLHFTGYSQGGWMTWRFVCKHADRIASAAPLAAGVGTGGGESCAFSGTAMPSRQVPILFAHGTTDGLVPFAGAVAQRDAVIAGWGLEEREVLSSGPDHEWKRWGNADGAVFEFAQHDWETAFQLGSTPLRGHCFPGSAEFLGCGADTAMKWGAAVLDFFQRHPMP